MKIEIAGHECTIESAGSGCTDGWVKVTLNGMNVAFGETMREAVRDAEKALEELNPRKED